MNVAYGYKGREVASKVQHFSDPGRVHACYFWHIAEHAVANVFHVLWDIAEVEIICKRGYDTSVVQLLVGIIGDGA